MSLKNSYKKKSDIGISLLNLTGEVIQKENPDTPENQHLLRQAMLEAFLEYLPVDKSEFLEFIPFYLRQSTNAAEGKSLEGILEIINDSTEESLE